MSELASEQEFDALSRVIKTTVAGFIDHPLTRRFLAKIAATGDNTVHTAADVLGERLMRVAGTLAASQQGELRTNLVKDEEPLAVAQFAYVAVDAAPYLWTEEVRAAVRESGSALPRHVISPAILPAPAMWWTLETGVSLDDDHEFVMDGCLIRDTSEGIDLYVFGELDDVPVLQHSRYAYGSVYPDDYEGLPQKTALTSLLQCLAFLNSPYIPKERTRLGRSERREIARKNAVAVGEEVTFINLRRPSVRRHDDAHENGTVDWQHRWMVSGHYRAQWYPSEAAHHLIWIAPYVKGPEDAPLLTHAYKVVR